MNIKESAVVTKSNSLIEAKYKLNTLEQKFIVLMASLIKPDEEDFVYYKLQVGEVIKELGIESNKDAYSRLKVLVSGLMGKKWTAKVEGGVLHGTWVASCLYGDNGYVEFEFSDRLKPYLLKLKEQFTTYQIQNILQLSSVYSIRLYELLKQYETIRKRSFTLLELREFLGIEKGKYVHGGHFKSRVIETAKTEINEKTDISFTYKEFKRGRKIEGFEFKIRSKNRKDTRKPVTATEITSNDEDLFLKTLVEADISKREAFKMLGLEWDYVNEEERAEAQKNHASFTQYVYSKLDDLQAQKSIENPTGWIIKAVKENWTGTASQTRQKAEEKQKKAAVKRIKEAQEQAKKEAQFQKQQERIEHLDALYEAMSKEEQRMVHEYVLERLLTHAKDNKKWQDVILDARPHTSKSWKEFKKHLDREYISILADGERRKVIEEDISFS